MEAADLKILAHIQHVARHFIAWRGALSSLTTFIIYDMGEEAPAPEVLDLFLRKTETQDELLRHFETGLWCASDKTYRLVCLAPPTNPEVAKRRLTYRPSSPTQCRWCSIDEKRHAETDLIPELDLKGEPVVAGSRLHPACLRPWKLMRALVDSAQWEEK